MSGQKEGTNVFIESLQLVKRERKKCIHVCSFVLSYNIWNFKKQTKYYILVGVFLFLFVFCTCWTLKWPTNEMKVPAVAHGSAEFETPDLDALN